MEQPERPDTDRLAEQAAPASPEVTRAAATLADVQAETAGAVGLVQRLEAEFGDEWQLVPEPQRRRIAQLIPAAGILPDAAGERKRLNGDQARALAELIALFFDFGITVDPIGSISGLRFNIIAGKVEKWNANHEQQQVAVITDEERQALTTLAQELKGKIPGRVTKENPIRKRIVVWLRLKRKELLKQDVPHGDIEDQIGIKYFRIKSIEPGFTGWDAHALAPDLFPESASAQAAGGEVVRADKSQIAAVVSPEFAQRVGSAFGEPWQLLQDPQQQRIASLMESSGILAPHNDGERHSFSEANLRDIAELLRLCFAFGLHTDPIKDLSGWGPSVLATRIENWNRRESGAAISLLSPEEEQALQVLDQEFRNNIPARIDSGSPTARRLCAWIRLRRMALIKQVIKHPELKEFGLAPHRLKGIQAGLIGTPLHELVPDLILASVQAPATAADGAGSVAPTLEGGLLEDASLRGSEPAESGEHLFVGPPEEIGVGEEDDAAYPRSFAAAIGFPFPEVSAAARQPEVAARAPESPEVVRQRIAEGILRSREQALAAFNQLLKYLSDSDEALLSLQQSGNGKPALRVEPQDHRAVSVAPDGNVHIPEGQHATIDIEESTGTKTTIVLGERKAAAEPAVQS